jgi:hypothetical protein
MDIFFSRVKPEGWKAALMRFFEVLPGTISWAIILTLFALSVFKPLTAALIIIAFVLSWLLRLLYTNIFLTISFIRYSIERETDWMARIRKMGSPRAYLGQLEQIDSKQSFKQKRSLRHHKRDLVTLLESGNLPPGFEDVHHLVIIPIVRERREIFEPGIRSMKEGRYPSERILVILAVEERSPAEVKREARAVCEKYRDSFLDLFVEIHPDGVEGEARVKGANTTHAAKKAAAYYREREVPFENIVVSCFDADTVVAPEYFSCLTYHFMACPDRTRASFQPIPVYHNNIWEAPGFARVLGLGSSFFQLVESTNPEKLVTFSSHSMSFKALVDVGYWPVDMISDDSAIYWKCFIHFKGDYRVVPMYITVSMDINQAETWWKTAVSVYKQQRRWAWGAESIPIVMTAFLTSRSIPLRLKLKHGYKLVQTHISWTTWPFILAVINWIPTIFVGKWFTHSIIHYNGPHILSTMFRLAFVGFFVYAVLSQLFLPRKKVKRNILKRIGYVLEWVLLPPISIAFGAIPALDAQTRLLLGKYMEFWVTVKTRKHAEPSG